MSVSFDLDRFLEAQRGSYETALAELRAGRKRSHWMWFVFPQVSGLGRSATSQRYAVAGLPEARAFLAHPVLGARLRECARVVADSEAASAQALLGEIDAVKLRSSMTLFAAAAGSDPAGRDAQVFRAVLDRYFAGETDEATLARL